MYNERTTMKEICIRKEILIRDSQSIQFDVTLDKRKVKLKQKI